jgi:dTDP-4-dehydrorhamnose reductase
MKECGHHIVGYDEKPVKNIDSINGNLYNVEKIQEIINEGCFDAIVNCSAVINQDAEKNKADASFINAFLPHFLERVTENSNTIVVHRSTDCIFSGKKGQYDLHDFPDDPSFYARTKSVGEIENKKDITIRTSLIGPELEKDGIGLFNWFYSQKDDINGFENSIWTGLTTIEFSREIEFLLKKKAHGLFQLVPNYSINKYNLLLLFEKSFPGNRKVIRVNNQRVDKSLKKVTNGYEIDIPEYPEMIEEMRFWIDNHSDLYRNYQR